MTRSILFLLLLIPAMLMAQTVKVLPAATFSETMQNRKASVVVVDVRTPQEFASGHIAGAINININDSQFDALVAKLDHSKTIMVYCRSGARSAAASRRLAGAGFKEIFDLQGGVISWSNIGYQLVR